MINKINITESEKNNILTLHKILNEATGLSIGGKVLDILTGDPIFDAKVVLTLSNTTKGMVKTDAEGNFKFDNLISGNYVISASSQSQGYLVVGEDVILQDTDILDKKILLSKIVNELQSMNVTTTKLTILDFIFVDGEGKSTPNVTYYLYNDKKNPIGGYISETGKSRLIFNSVDYQVKQGETITYPENSERGYFYSQGKSCQEKKDLIINAKINGYIEYNQKVTFCLNNGSYSTFLSKENGTVTATPVVDNESGIPTRNTNFLDSNVFKIQLLKPQISAKLLTLDNDNKILPNVSIDVYKNKDREELFQSLKTNQNGETYLNITTGNFELFNDKNDTVKKVRLFFDIKKEGYNTISEYGVIKYGKVDEYSWNLSPVKEPKEMNVRQCIKFTKDYYDNLVSVYNKSKTIQDLGGNGAIVDARNQVEACYVKHKKFYIGNAKKIVNKLTNVPPSLDIFELTFTFDEQKSIYKESTDMGMHNTILKVISEQSEKKSLLIKEGEIVESRLKFILNQSTKKTLRNNIIKEGNELISKGYDKKIVKEISLKIFHLNGI